MVTGTPDQDCGVEMTPGLLLRVDMSPKSLAGTDFLHPQGWGWTKSCYVKKEHGDGESGFSSEIILIKSHSEGFTQADAQQSGWNPKAGGCSA